VACFDVLSDGIIMEIEEDLADRLPGITTLQELCMLLINTVQGGGDPQEILNEVESIMSEPDSGISSDVVTEIMNCVQRSIV
jgi:hypothetical protein